MARNRVPWANVDATGKRKPQREGNPMNQIIYLVGLVVVVIFILKIVGLY